MPNTFHSSPHIAITLQKTLRPPSLSLALMPMHYIKVPPTHNYYLQNLYYVLQTTHPLSHQPNPWTARQSVYLYSPPIKMVGAYSELVKYISPFVVRRYQRHILPGNSKNECAKNVGCSSAKKMESGIPCARSVHNASVDTANRWPLASGLHENPSQILGISFQIHQLHCFRFRYLSQLAHGRVEWHSICD